VGAIYVISQAEPTSCMKLPTLEITAAIHKALYIGSPRGDHIERVLLIV